MGLCYGDGFPTSVLRLIIGGVTRAAITAYYRTLAWGKVGHRL